MFKALVELGRELEQKGDLPPPGFYDYKDPIRWRVRILGNDFLLTPIERHVARPFLGRTSGVQAHLLADEAAYALGVNKDSKGKTDRRAAEKFAAFVALLEALLAWPRSSDPAFQESVAVLHRGLTSGWAERLQGLDHATSKDWVEFAPEFGPLQGQPLFEHPDASRFWLEKLEEITSPGGKAVWGECAVCGNPARLIGRIPLGVKLVGNSPLHSFNQASFPSYAAGASPEKSVHLGLCFRCADTASRAFNHLSQNDRHRKRILSDPNKRDALTNQIALFWVKAPAPIETGHETLDPDRLNEMLVALLQGDATSNADSKPVPRATLAQIQSLVRLPWRPRESALSLDDYGFFLAVLSPNVGRIALREWIDVSLSELKQRLLFFLTATSIVSPWADPAEPRPVAELLRALESHNPNHLRGLLRAAYLGHHPPAGLAQAAVRAIRNVSVLQDPGESWRFRALAALIKLAMFYGSKEAETMQSLDTQRKSPGYLSGRLLAVLEEAQRRAQGFKINRTLVEKFYGAASTAPAATFGLLIRTAAVSHLQKAGSLNPLVEEIVSALDDSGGFPKTLTLEEQAEFALGFYHQRADFRAKNKDRKEAEAEVGHE